MPLHTPTVPLFIPGLSLGSGVSMNFTEYDQWTRLSQAASAWKQLPGFGTEELQALDKRLGTLYSHICAYNGDPLRRGHPEHRYVEVVHDDPVFTLLDISLGYIDAVMIGPVDRVIQMLTSDSRLMAASRSRAFCGPADDPWVRYVGEVLCLADAYSARVAMEELL